MTKALNWRKAQLHGKRSVSVIEEKEYRGNDAAARWLERNEKRKPSPPKPSAQQERA